MERPEHADGTAGRRLKIDYRDGRPVFFRALPDAENLQHYHDMNRSRKRMDR